MENLFKYEFTNNTGSTLSTRGPAGEPLLIKDKDILQITLNAASPVEKKVALKKAKHVYLQSKEFLLMIRTINSLLVGETYKVALISPETDSRAEKAPAEEPAEEADPVEKYIRIGDGFNAVMYVGETQTVPLEKSGIDSLRGIKIESSDVSVVKVSGTKLTATNPGDVKVTVKLAGCEAFALIEVRSKEKKASETEMNPEKVSE